MRGGYPGYAESDRVGETLREFFGVRCGRVKNVSSSLGSIWGVSAELRMPTHKGRVPCLPIVLPGWGDPSPNFWGPVRSGVLFRRTGPGTRAAERRRPVLGSVG